MSDVTDSKPAKDWGSEIADVLVQTAGVLEELAPEQWESPSLCEGWCIRDVAGHLVWRVGRSSAQMLIEGSKAYFGKHLNPMRAMDDLSAAAAGAEPEELVRQLRHIAALKLGGVGRTGLSELTEVVVHSYDMAQPLAARLAIEPRVSEAVAVGRTRIPMMTLHDVVAHRTLVATDAGWRLGRGPVIQGSAEAIVLFLFGRSALPR